MIFWDLYRDQRRRDNDISKFKESEINPGK